MLSSFADRRSCDRQFKGAGLYPSGAMPAIANPSIEPPKVNLQFYEQTGRPTIGDPVIMTADEFNKQTQTVVRGCYGVFDAAIPTQLQFGRTYHEVLTYAGTGEFRLISPPVLRWVTSETYGVRPLIFVQWVELSVATNSTVKNTINLQRFQSGRPRR